MAQTLILAIFAAVAPIGSARSKIARPVSRHTLTTQPKRGLGPRSPALQERVPSVASG